VIRITAQRRIHAPTWRNSVRGIAAGAQRARRAHPVFVGFLALRLLL